MVHTDGATNTPRAGFAGSSRTAGSSDRFPARAALAITPSWSRSSRPRISLDRKYDARIEARQEVFKLIELHCNTRRPYSSLGNLSPVEYERQCAH